jgi:predicted DNA-binding transcriptional regulator YafY
MLPTSARLLRLLSLLQARRSWSGADLAERLEVTDRTLRRDVDRLRALGYPVHSTSGVAGGYQLGAGAALPPLSLDDEEALAMSIALGTVRTGGVSGIDEAALRALVKLEQVLPARLRQRADALRASIIPLQHRGTPGVSATLLSTLAGACRDHTELTFRYADRGGRASERRVEPLGLVHAGYRWYFVAWDVGRADFRTFRVDRVEGDPERGGPFVPRPLPDDGDLRAFVSRSISTTVYPVQVSVILHAPYDRIGERLSPSAVMLERIDERRCRLRGGAHSLAVMAGWLVMLDVDFEVETPPELSVHLRSLHARLGRVIGPRKRPAKGSRARRRCT